MTEATDLVDKAALEGILNGDPAASATASPGGSTVDATLVANVGCLLGECVLYDERLHSILWTDIDGRAFYQLKLFDEKGHDLRLTRTPLPRMLGAFCLTSQPNVYLFGWQDGFQLWNVDEREAVSEYSRGPLVNPRGLPSRLNDGRCDPKGEHFVCGGFFGGNDNIRMKVFSCHYEHNRDSQQQQNKDDAGTTTTTSIHKQLVHEPIMQDVKITNSLCFSPDGTTMYFCDSPTKVIQQYDYDDCKQQDDGSSTCTPRFQRNVWKWTGDDGGFPDGSCVDEDGFLWSALWRRGAGPGRVHRIDPSSGRVVYTIHMPDTTSQCTCVCFGGKDFNVLFITTASIYRDCRWSPMRAAFMPSRCHSEDEVNLAFSLLR